MLLGQEPDVQKLEEKINCGQIEEVIFQVSLIFSSTSGGVNVRSC